jgi:glyoxylase-like metal-dependent hydrolase (beta-lactamase superfamily II)
VKPSAAVVRAVRPGLHLLETEVEDFDVRAAVLLGTERAVVFDTLAHPVHVRGVAGLVADLPLTVVYSHADWDHVWGTCGLSAVEEVVALDAAARRFTEDVPVELRGRREREPGAWDDVELVPPTRTFGRAITLHLGGIDLELEVLPGHTPDCLVGFVPEWGLLLAGDTVETPLPVVNEGAAVAAWVEGLARWLADPRVAQVVPSHGRVGGRELIGQTLDYLRSLTHGGDPPESSHASPFYRETHLRNLRAVGRSPTGSI